MRYLEFDTTIGATFKDWEGTEIIEVTIDQDGFCYELECHEDEFEMVSKGLWRLFSAGREYFLKEVL